MNALYVQLADGAVLRMEQQMIDVTTTMPQPDPHWTFTDAAGHAHARASVDTGAGPYPTLSLVDDPPYFCADCRDEHSDSHYECVACGDTIVPGSYIDTLPRSIPGVRRWYLNDEPIDEDPAHRLMADVAAAL